MDNKEKMLVVGAIDDFLKESLGYSEMLTDDEYDQVEEYLKETVDTTSPKDLRDSLASLGKKLYSDVFEEEEKEYAVAVIYEGEDFVKVSNHAVKSMRGSHHTKLKNVELEDLNIRFVKQSVGLGEGQTAIIFSIKI